MSGWWNPGDPAPIVAVAIGVNPDGATHTGLVYREDETGDKLRLLHLRFHFSLGNDRFSLDTRIVEGIEYHLLIPNIPQSMLAAVALRCRYIAREKPKLSFGFASTRITFDEKGRPHIPADNRGLNCATFVLRVLESVSVWLVEEKSWQHRDEDEKRFNELLEILQGLGTKWYHSNLDARKEHLAYVKKIAPDVKCVRVRPEEVAGACLSQTLRVQFTEGCSYGCEVLQRVKPAPVPPPHTPLAEATPQSNASP